MRPTACRFSRERNRLLFRLLRAMRQSERGRNQTGGCLGLIVVSNRLVMYGQREAEESLHGVTEVDIYL